MSRVRRTGTTLAALALATGCGDDEPERQVRENVGPPELLVSVGLRDGRYQRFRPQLRIDSGTTVAARVQILNERGAQARRLRLRIELPPGARLLAASQSVTSVKPPETPSPLRGDVTAGIPIVPLVEDALRVVRFRFRPGDRGGEVRATVTGGNAETERAAAALIVE